MKKLLAKIRKILRDRRTRRFLTRFVSGVAAIVVFVTTYALVLPAITMEKEANCGIEAHQHDESCYTEELICDIPEGDGHHHDESCYSITSTLICGMDEHEHSVETGCYDEDGNLICEKKEHRHNDECYEETRELTCQIPESEGHQHTDACYEKVLTCGKEIHIHSTACYEYDFVSDSAVAASTSSASAAATSAGSVSSAGMTLSFVDETVRTAGTDEQAAMDQPVDNDRAIDNNGFIDNGGLGETDGSSEIGGLSETDRSSETASSGEGNTVVPMEMTYGSENAGTGSTEASNAALTNADNSATALTSSTAADQYIPPLEAVDFNTVLNDCTGIYYHHVADGETVEDSHAIPAEDWNRIPNNTDNTDLMENMDDVELGGNDLLRVYLSYTIPAGSLNATNPVARYRLPSNLHLTDSQVKAINENVNGIAGQYVDLSTLEITDPDMYNAYLGVEAVEGTRRPDETVEDYLEEQARKVGTDPDDAAEYISAVARVENVYDADGIYGEKDAYLGQDLIFTFAPYSIEKNQHEYDSKGQPTKAGQEIKGWLPLDLNLGQVDFGEAEITTSTVDVTEAEDVDGLTEDDRNEDERSEDGHIEEERNEDEHTEDGRIEDDHTEDSRNEDGRIEDEDASEGQTEDEHNANDNNAENSVEDKENNPAGESGEDTENPRNNTVTIERSERTAEIVFVEEGWDQKDNKIDQISTRVTVVEKTVIQTQDNDTEENSEEAAAENSEEPGEGSTEESAAGNDADQSDKGDTDQVIMPAMSFTDSIRVSTGKPAGIDEDVEGTLGSAVRSLPQEAEVSVRVEADEGTFPAGTTMVLKAVEDLDAVAEAVTETVENSDPSVSADGADHQSEQTEDSKNNNGTEEKKNLKTYGFQAVDITFLDKDGKEIQPAKPVRVAMTSEIAEQVKEEAKTGAVADPVVVHVDDDGNAEQMELVAPEEIEPAQGKTEGELLEEDQTSNGEQEETGTTNAAGEAPSVGFTADSFSVYAIVYTVDFEYSVNGKMYQFSLPGGGFVSFTDLVEVLDIIGDPNTHEKGNKNEAEIAENAEENGNDEWTEESDISSAANMALTLGDVEASDAVKKFVADVDSVEFSNPELVDVSKAENETTVGQIKENRGLECEYSLELTEEQTEEINSQTVEVGDWALISVKPFSSQETLTVTMKTGEVFEIRVTDYQISTNVLTTDGQTYKITVTYGDDAEIPDGTKLVASEIEPGTDEYIQHLGKAWAEVNKEYFEVEEMRENYDESMGELPDVPYTNINTARFFDISLIYNDEEIEPKAPVRVEISYVQGLKAWEETTPGVAHYVSETQVEIIEDVETIIQDNEVTSFRYEQDSFSGVGTYVAQEIQDSYVEPKLAAFPDPNGSTTVKSANLTDEALNEVVLSSLKSSDLLRAGETEESDENDHTDLEKPEAHKTLTPNKDESNQEDGTYTLTLSVKGHSSVTTETTVKKSNVLVVMDRSSSMITKTVSDDSTRWYYGTKNTSSWRGDLTEGNGYHFIGVVNNQDVDLIVSYDWQVGGSWSNPVITYQSGVDRWGNPQYSNYPDDSPIYVVSKKTRMTAEQEALSTLFTQLMENNNASGVNTDVVEISVISFGDERFDDKSWSNETEIGWQSGRDTSVLMGVVNSNRFTSGTNWEEALQYAYEVISSKKTAEENAGNTNEDYYVIFLTDGEPTAIEGESGGAHHTTDPKTGVITNGQGNIYAYEESKDAAKALVDAGFAFYNIFTFRTTEDDKYSIYLTNYAYGNGNGNGNTNTDAVQNYYEDAQTIDSLKNKFDDIFNTIEDSIGHGNVSITDTLTTDAMTTTVVQYIRKVPSVERPKNRALQKPSTLYIWYFSFEQSRAALYVKSSIRPCVGLWTFPG